MGNENIHLHQICPQPILTIAIPTWNRSDYLEKNLIQLKSEILGIEVGLVEILVSDNCSPDNTLAVVEKGKEWGLPISYIRNNRNLGWGPNFAQCYNLARGQYVLLLGDDDLLVDGALSLIVSRLLAGTYGVICIRPYGFDNDFRQEYPGSFGREIIFREPGDFLLAIGANMTLLSACIINRRLLSKVDISDFYNVDLAALKFVLRAVLLADQNLYLEKYLVAAKRNNSSNYDFSEVFVCEMWKTIDDFQEQGLQLKTIKKLENRLLFAYYPFYLFSMRVDRIGDPIVLHKHFKTRFQGRWRFEAWIAPILWLPRPMALVWGAFTTIVGRVIDGDLRRGLAFLWYRLYMKFS